MSDSNNRLLNYVHDKDLIDYYYLNLTIDGLIDKLHNLTFTLTNDKSIVPFNAQLRDYKGAIDNDGNKWIVKKVIHKELFEHRLFELAYYLDFMLKTLAVPSILTKIDGIYYRASKIVLNAIQISGYNYMENPFKKVLTNDLINRWLFFDEDRNPNNYMVIFNSQKKPLIITIDYNKADLASPKMKITGNDKEFGWFREEKTRFLTLLKPSNFENLTIDNFDYRLSTMMSLDLNKLKEICIRLFKDIIDDYEEKAELIISNISNRRTYINEYFRRWFKEKDITKEEKEDSDYSGLGKSFLKIYKDKK